MGAIDKWITFETCRLMALFGDFTRDVNVTVWRREGDTVLVRSVSPESRLIF